MKKLLGILLVLALVAPATAGNIMGSIETYGEIQTIGARISNAQDAGSTLPDHNRYSETTNRVLFGLSADLVEDVRANVSFLHTNYWGDSTTSGNVGQGASVQSYLDTTTVVEANVVVSNIFGALEAKVGRQFYGDEDSKIIYYGPTHYRSNLAAQYDSYSFDGAVVSYTTDKWMAEVVYGKLAAAPLTQNDNDTSLFGVNAKAFVTDALSLQAYAYDFRDRNQTEPHSGVWGVKPTFNADGIKASVEFAKNYDGDVFGYNKKGWMIAGDVSAQLALEDLDVTPRAGYYRTEKEFQSDGNYAPGLLVGGAINGPFDGANLENYQVINAGVDFKLAGFEKLSLAFDYYAISMGDKDNAQWLGNEFDLIAKYAVNEYVEFHAGAAYMTSVKESFAKTDPYMGQLGMLIKF